VDVVLLVDVAHMRVVVVVVGYKHKIQLATADF